VQDKGYVGLGWSDGAAPLNDWWEYNPASGAWTRLPDFPGEARSAAFQFAIGDKVYVGGGTRFQPGVEYITLGYNDVYEYTTTTRTWRRVADFPQTSSNGQGVIGAYHFSAGGLGFVGGGRDNYNLLYSLYRYDPAADQWSWEAAHPLNYQRELYPVLYGASFAIGDLGYMGMGFTTLRGGEISDRFFSYDYRTKKWQELWFSGRPVAHPFSASNSGTGLVGFGYQTQEIWQYVGGNLWKQVSRCPDDFLNKGGIAFTIGTKTYIGLGVPGLSTLNNRALYEYTHTR
jgi:hypothetical protein